LELPEKIWLQVFQYLSVRDVNNVHLVCKELHQIANLHVNPKLSFKRKSTIDVESLVESTRIFEEVEFVDDQTPRTYLQSLNPKNFEILEDYIEFIGSHVKKFVFSIDRTDLVIFLKLLNSFPNLESLELDLHMDITEPINWTLRSTKIKQLKLISTTSAQSFVESLEKCRIKELELDLTYSNGASEALKKFLKSQEKNLKRLTGKNCDFSYLTDLRLEYLDFGYCNEFTIPTWQFLKFQVDLKVLVLIVQNMSDDDFSMILRLKNLEVLELDGWMRSELTALNKLHKLEKLKRLKATPNFIRNILDHMEFGVFNALEELDASFKGASEETTRELEQIAPNLKKIWYRSGLSADTTNAMLDALEHLEAVQISEGEWAIPSNKVYPKIKTLYVSCKYGFNYSPEQLLQTFPNLEIFKNERSRTQVITESFFVTLLSGLKHLKALHMFIKSRFQLDRTTVYQCIQEFGKHLIDVEILLGFQGHTPGFAIEKGSDGSFFTYDLDPSVRQIHNGTM
jgi:hypothetical protein